MRLIYCCFTYPKRSNYWWPIFWESVSHHINANLIILWFKCEISCMIELKGWTPPIEIFPPQMHSGSEIYLGSTGSFQRFDSVDRDYKPQYGQGSGLTVPPWRTSSTEEAEIPPQPLRPAPSPKEPKLTREKAIHKQTSVNYHSQWTINDCANISDRSPSLQPEQ